MVFLKLFSVPYMWNLMYYHCCYLLFCTVFKSCYQLFNLSPMLHTSWVCSMANNENSSRSRSESSRIRGRRMADEVGNAWSNLECSDTSCPNQDSFSYHRGSTQYSMLRQMSQLELSGANWDIWPPLLKEGRVGSYWQMTWVWEGLLPSVCPGVWLSLFINSLLEWFLV